MGKEDGGGGGEKSSSSIINSHTWDNHRMNDDGDENDVWNTRMGLGRLRCYLPYWECTGECCCIHTHRTGPPSTWARSQASCIRLVVVGVGRIPAQIVGTRTERVVSTIRTIRTCSCCDWWGWGLRKPGTGQLSRYRGARSKDQAISVPWVGEMVRYGECIPWICEDKGL